MPANIFQKLQTKAAAQFGSSSNASMDWYRNTAKRVRRANPEKLLKDAELTNSPLPGRMYLFNYQPKYEKDLPYWDKFPLIFFLEVSGGLFSGLNLHYLPPKGRAKLMDMLYQYAINMEKGDKTTAIAISYRILEASSRMSLFKPTFKRYLKSHMRSSFLYISPEKWDVAMMLPLARFQKQSINKVYKDSREKAK